MKCTRMFSKVWLPNGATDRPDNPMSSYCLWSSRTKTRTATFFAALGGHISDASWRRFVLYLRFWNQILTCVSVSFRAAASSALSGPDKYFWWLNRLSNSKTWACEKAALDRFFRGLACCWGLEVEVWLTSLSWFSVMKKQKKHKSEHAPLLNWELSN